MRDVAIWLLITLAGIAILRIFDRIGEWDRSRCRKNCPYCKDESPATKAEGETGDE